MDRLSAHYRSDTSDGLDKSVRRYLDTHYLAHIKNIHRHNPKLLVVFSGGNAMGKTTISRKIESKLRGLVLENDEIKRHLLKFNPHTGKDELNRSTWQYTMSLYHNLENITSNGLIVRDGVIDWYYDRILPIFEQAGYELFIIGFDVTREKALEQIRRRGDTATVKEERFYVLLADHLVHTRRFRAAYKPDIMLNDNTLFDHNKVIEKLQQKLIALGDNTMNTSSSVDEYINQFSREVKARLTQIRNVITSEAPDAEEGIMYGLAGYKLRKKPLVYFGGFTHHIGFYATPNGHAAFKEELSKYKQGKGSVQFPAGEPLPLDLIRRIVRYRCDRLMLSTTDEEQTEQ